MTSTDQSWGRQIAPDGPGRRHVVDRRQVGWRSGAVARAVDYTLVLFVLQLAFGARGRAAGP